MIRQEEIKQYLGIEETDFKEGKKAINELVTQARHVERVYPGKSYCLTSDFGPYLKGHKITEYKNLTIFE